MYLVRNIFHAKPGKAKALVQNFKNMTPHVEELGVAKNTRILTDTASTFWTVIIEQEVEDLNAYMNMAKTLSKNEKFVEAAKGYAECANGGHREVFQIE